MKIGNKKTTMICATAFFICSLLCIVCYIAYAYLATPKIILNGAEEITLNLNDKYEEKGAKATLDNIDITNKIEIDNPVDTSKVGDYIVTYSVTNKKGIRKQEINRRVKIRETENPVIKLKKSSTIKVQYGEEFKDPGCTAKDNYDGDISDKVEVQGLIDTKKIGTYKLYYTVTDSSENTATVVRKVEVVDTKAPKITINGKKHTVTPLNKKYKDEGCKAIDNHDGDISGKVKKTGTVNTSVAGYYTINYSITDSFGNKSETSRVVQVGTQNDIDNANYILISISEQRLWFYKNNVLELSSNIVTGLQGKHDTPRGTYRIRGKAQSIYLTGPDYKSFVYYWMPIDYGSGIGLHDATWRSSFGGYIYQTAGSHGCINLPYNVAQTIYYNAPTGIYVKII